MASMGQRKGNRIRCTVDLAAEAGIGTQVDDRHGPVIGGMNPASLRCKRSLADEHGENLVKVHADSEAVRIAPNSIPLAVGIERFRGRRRHFFRFRVDIAPVRHFSLNFRAGRADFNG